MMMHGLTNINLFQLSDTKGVDGPTQLEPLDRAYLYVWV